MQNLFKSNTSYMLKAAIKAPDLSVQKLEKLPLASWSVIPTESD